MLFSNRGTEASELGRILHRLSFICSTFPGAWILLLALLFELERSVVRVPHAALAARVALALHVARVLNVAQGLLAAPGRYEPQLQREPGVPRGAESAGSVCFVPPAGFLSSLLPARHGPRAQCAAEPQSLARFVSPAGFLSSPLLARHGRRVRNAAEPEPSEHFALRAGNSPLRQLA